MSKGQRVLLAVLACLAAATASNAEEPHHRIVVYDGVATQVKVAERGSRDLWVTSGDLTRATRFVIKPQGICRDELCFPIPSKRKSDFIAKRSSVAWFNMSEFARLLKQPVAYDEVNDVWYFGPRPDARDSYVSSLEAPDFTLPDLAGKMHSLSDFRGKKVLLVTWASW